MIIRAITTGISLDSPHDREKIKQAAEFNRQAKNLFEQFGHEVQTTRIATNSWEEYLKNFYRNEIVNIFQKIEQFCEDLNINFFNIG
ncbi:hypothetical protein CEN39_02025, partial [Fischerella thermalis CCMEE 5201]